MRTEGPLVIPAIRLRHAPRLALLVLPFLLLFLFHCAEAPQVGAFRCPMHPGVVADAPGECSICGMKLVPAPEARGEASGDSGIVALTPEAVSLAGIRSEPAIEGGVRRMLRVQGFVVPEPARERHVVSRIGGWLEALHVTASGTLVKRGDPLYTLHAPDLVPLQEQYVFFLGSRESGAPQDGQETAGRPPGERDARLEGVRRRMRLYDLPEELPAELERGARPRSSITFPARYAGFVKVDGLFAGRQIEPNTDMMTITDLSSVWIEADLFEADIPGIANGQDAVVTIPSNPGWRGACRIAAISPSLDPVKGTLRIWAGCPNDGMVLKPGMTASIETPMRQTKGVLIPSSSILSDGDLKVAYVEGEQGRFSRREVTTGLRDGEKTQILAGIAAGERIVTRGAFLIESERRLRARSPGAPGTSRAGDGAPPAAAVVEAALGSLEVPLRASGRVVAIPDRVHHLVIRTMGWIKTLAVKSTGTRVRAGEMLFTLDAPDLVPIQEEYLLSLAGISQSAGSGQGVGVEGALGRLKRHGVQDAFIAELERGREAKQVVPFVSPIGGYVTLERVYEGERVEPGMELMVVTDLSSVWVEADLYAIAAAPATGRKAAVSLLHDPGVRHEGTVIGIDPFIDPASRTMTLRVLCANQSLALRPGMSAFVDLGAETFSGVIVPDSAVVDTGLRHVTFVQDAQGRFQPRDVSVGAHAGGRIQILSGLQPGERVALSASFLLDPDAAMPGSGAGGGDVDTGGSAR